MPPPPIDRARRSLRAGSIGAFVAALAGLVVTSIGATLTGGEGDLGLGLIMMLIAFVAAVAIVCLGIVAISSGWSSLRNTPKADRSRRARIGIALGVVELGAVIATLAIVIVIE